MAWDRSDYAMYGDGGGASAASSDKRGLQTLKNRFRSQIGRDPTAQDYADFIDPASGRIWGGLYDNLDSHIAERGRSAPSVPSGGGSSGAASSSRSVPVPAESPRTDFVDRQVDAIQYADDYAEAMDKIYSEYAPNQYKLPEEMAGTISERLKTPGKVPNWMRQSYLSDLRGAYSAAGMRRSSRLAEAEPEGLSRLGLDLYGRDINAGLALAARSPQVQFTVPQVSDYYGADLGYQTSANALSENARQFNIGQENQMFQWARGPNNVTNAGAFSSGAGGGSYARGPNPFVTFAGQAAGEFASQGFENYFDTGSFFPEK